MKKEKALPIENDFVKRREFYWLVLLTVPTVLMAVVSVAIPDSFSRLLTQIVLFFFQVVVAKGILENTNH